MRAAQRKGRYIPLSYTSQGDRGPDGVHVALPSLEAGILQCFGLGPLYTQKLGGPQRELCE